MNNMNEINVFYMRVFTSLYENKNAMSVAKSLDVAPSKISRCLSSLRHTLNDQLFIRRQYGFEATAMADKLYPCFQQLLATVEQVEHISHPEQANVERELTIHAPATLRNCLFTRLQQALSQQGLHYSLNVKPLSEHTPDELLQQGSDLVLAFQPSESEQCDSHFIAKGEQLFLIAHEDHPLFSRPDGEMLEQCLNYPFVIVDCPAFNDKVDPLELYAIERQRNIKIAGHMSGLSEAANHLRQTDNFTFVASSCAAEFFNDFPELKARRFTQPEFDQLHERSDVPLYYAIQRKSAPVPPTVIQALDQLIGPCVTLQR